MTRGSILADIGGTNARFAFLSGNGEIGRVKKYEVEQNPTLIGALLDYRDTECGDCEIVSLALAIAGPVLGDVVKLTNSNWVCDRGEIAKEFSTEAVFLFNDFEASAMAVADLKKTEVDVLQAGEKSTRCPMLIMGPGTGLGVAALKPILATGGFEPIATEAGHARYAAADEHEEKIVHFLSSGTGFVRAEDLISGPGLVNLYRANCHLMAVPQRDFTPADVVIGAREGDKACGQALDDFSAMFGSFASSLALGYGALGGVYLTGGVLQKMGGDFRADKFLERFNSNPKMAGLLRKVPILRVKPEIPAFAGLKTAVRLNLS